MSMDREGWTASEKTEIANHLDNKSWEYVDRSEFEKLNRRLVKTVWVYKVKRNGKLKSRLCVQLYGTGFASCLHKRLVASSHA